MAANKKSIYFIFSLLAVVCILAACGTSTDEVEPTEKSESKSADTTNYPAEVTENPIVTITMDSDEKIVVELDPKVAPNTVANFIFLAEDGFYNGLIFHRVIPGFMIQGGDPQGNGTGGPDYSINGEFNSNGFENNIKHERGVISMARTQDPNSAGSQFFIMVANAPSLDGEYAAFGRVIEGMETVDKIVSVERNQMDKPLQDQIIKKVEVDTKGFNYPDPTVQ